MFISPHFSAYVKLIVNMESVDCVSFPNKPIRGKKNIENNNAVSTLIESLDLDKHELFKRNLKFEKTRNDFFNALFFCTDEREELFQQVLCYENCLKSSPYTIDILMIKYVYTVSVIEDYSSIKYYLDNIGKIIPFLSKFYQKTFYVFLLYYYLNISRYEKIMDIYSMGHRLTTNDIHLEGRLYYLGLSIYRRFGLLSEAKKCYHQACFYLSKANNIAMLENLNLKYSGLLRISGEIQAALKNDLKLLEDYTVKQYRLRNIEILFNNIGWTYSLLHNYKKAVIYYQKALETLNDNDVYFNMAYCLYKIGEDNLSLTYIQRGRKAPVSNAFITPFFDWLELMIEKPYCSKSYELLKAISTDYSYCLEDINKTMIQIEIINYYYYNHMYEEAIHALQPLMGKQLISPSELIFTKKNENRHDFLFSEDELTLRSQMMESDDLFFEDDELGEDEWEELDDSFSRFTHN